MERHDLEYAGPDTVRRTSRLAITSLILGIMGAPCIMGRINWHNLLAKHFSLYGPDRYLVVTWIARLLPLLAILSGLASLGCIARQRRLRGLSIAVTGIVLGVLWLLLMYLAELMWRGFSPG